MADCLVGGGTVAELQGLYGPFSFPEKILQGIWFHRDFALENARTIDGRELRILDPGRWNHLGGPDFRNARLQIGGDKVIGDVEVHLDASDWVSHGHDRDPAYAGVVLHVVLFQTQKTETIDVHGRPIPVLVLLPLLHHDLEAYAADDAIERLSDHPVDRVRQALLAADDKARDQELGRHASQRWLQKVHFARCRLERLGWREACHHTALEILGYRFNRAAMLGAATAHPLTEWVAAPEAVAAAAFREGGERWARQGARPANQPGTRLRQYARWVSACPDWPEKVRSLCLPKVSAKEPDDLWAARRDSAWRGLRDRVLAETCGSAVGGCRANTLVCDGYLPLLAACDTSQSQNLAAIWRAWQPGDVPVKHARLLRDAGVAGGPGRPLCHGLFQGLLGWLIAHEPHSESACPTSIGRGA